LDDKAPEAFRTISEVAVELDLPQHVLRFWESRFREIKPMKRGGGRRYYRPDDIDLLRGIRHLLYGEGYTIRGVQRILRDQGIKFVQIVWQEGAAQPPHGARGEAEADDEAAAETETVEEEAEEDGDQGRGLAGKLGALIGRDLNGRDEPGERREPPMVGAPVPRIDPADRAMHNKAEPEPVRPAAPPTSLSENARPRDERQKLQSVLDELVECRKLLDSALMRAD
jgi:DNA-binding transcriptional MerR regulator